jgi:phosphatidylserine/phosphatidylglycerophosphate/cardiolipin synthase-like enzyme
MKRFIILSLVISFYSSPQTPPFNDPDLGRTHFIVGLPIEPHGAPKKQPVVCQPSSLPGLLRCNDGSYKQAFFSPDDDLQGILIQLINNEKSSIRAAIYSFTDGDIARALIEAHERGIVVEIITDHSSMKDKFNKLELLKKSKITVLAYNPRTVTVLNNIMHNKFVLFGKNVEDKSLLWTGSFNWTKSAKVNNQENVIVLDEAHLFDRYDKQFALLKERTMGKKALKVARGKRRKMRTITA